MLLRQHACSLRGAIVSARTAIYGMPYLNTTRRLLHQLWCRACVLLSFHQLSFHALPSIFSPYHPPLIGSSGKLRPVFQLPDAIAGIPQLARLPPKDEVLPVPRCDRVCPVIVLSTVQDRTPPLEHHVRLHVWIELRLGPSMIVRRG